MYIYPIQFRIHDVIVATIATMKINIVTTIVTTSWSQNTLSCVLVYFPSHKQHQSNAATLQGVSLGPILWAEMQQSMPTQGARHDVIVATIATTNINIVTTTVTTSWSQNTLCCVLVYFPSHKQHQLYAATLQGMSQGPKYVPRTTGDSQWHCWTRI
jgi:hypothetical protein